MKRRMSRLRGGVAGVALSALAIAGLGAAPAQAAATDQAEAEGNFLSGHLLGLNTDIAAEVARAYSGNVSSPAVDDHPFDVTALSALQLNLGGGVQLPLFDDGDGDGVIGLGAVGQYAKTGKSPNTAFGSSGLLGNNGVIGVGDTSTPEQDAYLDLTNLLKAAGVSGITDQLVSELRLDLGAIAASATQTGSDPATGTYKIAGGKLTLDSPAVKELSATLNTNLGAALSGVQDGLGGLIGTDGALTGALSGTTQDISDLIHGVLAIIPGVGSAVQVDTPVITAGLDVSSLDTVLDDLLAKPITDPDGLISLDLGAGTLTVDLAKAVQGSNGGDLNGLPANTDILSSETVNAIVTGVQNAVNALTTKAIDTVTDAVNGLNLTLKVTAGANLKAPIVGTTIVGGNIVVNIDGTLGGFLGTNGSDAPTATTAGTTLTALGVPLPVDTLADGIAQPVLDLVQTAVGGVLNTTLDGQTGIIATALDGVLKPIVTTLQPVFDALTQVASVKVNVQERDGNFETATAQDKDSFTERAVQVTLLKAAGPNGAAQVNLGSATVRTTGTDVTPTYDTAITADPTSVESGKTTGVSGTGFAPGEKVTITGGDADVTATADDNGAFGPVDVTVSGADGDKKTLTATGATSATPATTEVTVTAPTTAADVNANAAASAAASAQADSDNNAAAQAAAVAAALADASTVADAAATANADKAAASAATSDATANASQDASSDATSAATAAAVAAAQADNSDKTNAEASATKDANAAAASQAAATADSSKDASAAAAADSNASASADPEGSATADADQASANTTADADVNANAAASAAASAQADSDKNAVAQAAAQAAANPDADSAKSAAADATAAAAAEAAVEADASKAASSDATTDKNAAAQAAAAANASSADDADASAAAESNAGAAAAAASNASSSADASSAAAADADGAKDAGVNANAAASAGASAQADADNNAVAQAAAQAAALADATSAASVDADASANAAAEKAATADASKNASSKADSDANNAAAASAQAAAMADATSDSNAQASAMADSNANSAAAASAASTADSSSEASAAAAANGSDDSNANSSASADANANGNSDAKGNEPKSTVTIKKIVRGTGVTQVVKGSDFKPGETVKATVYSTSIDLGTTKANAKGEVTFTFPVGAGFVLGEHHVTLVGDASGEVKPKNDTTQFTVVGKATVVVEPDHVKPGGEVKVSGDGFNPGETVDITLSTDPSKVIGTAKVDKNGHFSGTLSLSDNFPAGKVTVTATGQDSKLHGSDVLTVDKASSNSGPGGNGGNTGTGFTGDDLAHTGANVGLAVGGAAILLLLGGLTVWGTRRRRSHQA